jgi:hypothetical protein
MQVVLPAERGAVRDQVHSLRSLPLHLSSSNVRQQGRATTRARVLLVCRDNIVGDCALRKQRRAPTAPGSPPRSRRSTHHRHRHHHHHHHRRRRHHHHHHRRRRRRRRRRRAAAAAVATATLPPPPLPPPPHTITKILDSHACSLCSTPSRSNVAISTRS